jgi:hypothetical protein
MVWDPLEIRWIMVGIGFGESVGLCVNLCLPLDNNLHFLLDNNLCLLLDNTLCLLWDNLVCWTIPLMDILYLIGILGSSICNINIVNMC